MSVFNKNFFGVDEKKSLLAIAVYTFIFFNSVHFLGIVQLNAGRFNYNIYDWSALVVAITVVLLALILAVKHRFSIPSRHYFPWFFIGLVLLFAALFVREYFGFLDINSILYHVVVGMDGVQLDADIYYVGGSIFIALMSLSLALYNLGKYSLQVRKFLNLLTLPMLLLNPVSLAYAKNIMIDVADLAPGRGIYKAVEYIAPIRDERKNIIHIYLESTEHTLEHITDSQWAMEPLQRIASTGFQASAVRQVASTGWTIAGIVASQCGVPLVYPSLQRLSWHNGNPSFLPGVDCLPDILEQSGYTTVFARGFNLEFAGTDSFLNSHSYSRSIGLMAHENYVDRPKNHWGSYDDDIYRFAIDEINQLARGDAPYYFTLTTNGGHFPNGHVSPSCRKGTNTEWSHIDIVNAIACTNHLTEEFVRELNQRGLLENTIVVIQSDHLLMRSPLTPMLDKHERVNFFSIIGDGVKPAISNKEASMMDVYPTILEFAGYEIVDRKAGLGVSLLSEHPSLLEQFGQVTVDHSLVANKELSVAIWAAGDP